MPQQNLNNRDPIVNGEGVPNDYFIRMFQARGGDADQFAEDLAALLARILTAGAGLTGGGTLEADRTFNVGAGTGITVNADDVAIDLTAEAERIRDTIGAALTAGAGVTITVDDPGNTITIACSVTAYTDEMAQDAIAAMLAAGAHTGITVTYNDAGNAMSIACTITQYTDELARTAISVTPTTVATTTYTLVLADAYEYVRLTNAAGCDVTVPPNSSVAFPIGTTITFRTTASAASKFTPGAGVTLNKVGGGTGTQTFAEIGATTQLKKVGTNEWDMIGGLL